MKINHFGLFFNFHQRKAIMTVFKQSNGVWFVFMTATQSPTKEDFERQINGGISGLDDLISDVNCS